MRACEAGTGSSCRPFAFKGEWGKNERIGPDFDFRLRASVALSRGILALIAFSASRSGDILRFSPVAGDA